MLDFSVMYARSLSACKDDSTFRHTTNQATAIVH